MKTKELWGYLDRLVGTHGIDNMIEDQESDIEEDTELDEIIRRETDVIEFLECACTCGIDCDMAEEEVDPVREAMLEVEKEIKKLEKGLQEKVPNLFKKFETDFNIKAVGTGVDITKLSSIVKNQPSGGAKNTSSRRKLSHRETEADDEDEEADDQTNESLIPKHESEENKETLLRSRGPASGKQTHSIASTDVAP